MRPTTTAGTSLRQWRSELCGVRLRQLVERGLILRTDVRLRERAPRLPEIRIDLDRALQLRDAGLRSGGAGVAECEHAVEVERPGFVGVECQRLRAVRLRAADRTLAHRQIAAECERTGGARP